MLEHTHPSFSLFLLQHALIQRKSVFLKLPAIKMIKKMLSHNSTEIHALHTALNRAKFRNSDIIFRFLEDFGIWYFTASSAHRLAPHAPSPSAWLSNLQNVYTTRPQTQQWFTAQISSDFSHNVFFFKPPLETLFEMTPLYKYYGT